MSLFRLAAAACTALLLASGPARADATAIRFAQQQSIGYLQFNVLKHEHLLEKRAAELGIPNLQVSWLTLSGPDAMNDALLSGSVDVVAGGVPALLIVWGRTRGTANEVRGICALTQGISRLNTNDPAIHSLRDVGPDSRIALPAVRSSIQAILLQMAAAREFGPDNWGRFDAQTRSLSPADASTGLVSGSSGFDMAFTPPPFPALQLRSPKVHTVLTTFDVVGESSASVAWTSKRFHDANPVLYRALLDSLRQASDFINEHKREAVGFYIEDSHSTMTLDELMAIAFEPHASFGVVPKGVETFGTFMARTGTLKAAPASWKDAFFPEVAGEPGN